MNVAFSINEKQLICMLNKLSAKLNRKFSCNHVNNFFFNEHVNHQLHPLLWQNETLFYHRKWDNLNSFFHISTMLIISELTLKEFNNQSFFCHHIIYLIMCIGRDRGSTIVRWPSLFKTLKMKIISFYQSIS